MQTPEEILKGLEYAHREEIEYSHENAVNAMEEYAAQFTATTALEERIKELEEDRKRLVGMMERDMKRQMRISMPEISADQQDETWKRYAELNNL